MTLLHTRRRAPPRRRRRWVCRAAKGRVVARLLHRRHRDPHAGWWLLFPSGPSTCENLETNQPTSRGAHAGETVLYRTTRLPPCDQIVERVNVWRKAENDPTDCAPKNNSVIHRPPN